jgi:hypothetical protein
MIVKKMWRKEKDTRDPKGNKMMVEYSGWFLFGIIPLFIETTRIYYYWKH